MTGAEADDSDALRAAFAGVLIREYGACDDGEEAQAWLAAEHLLPLVLAYGREQATREAAGVRLARCENVSEPEGIPCRGLLAFQPGDRQAACSRCQAWCGVQVADYLP